MIQGHFLALFLFYLSWLIVKYLSFIYLFYVFLGLLFNTLSIFDFLRFLHQFHIFLSNKVLKTAISRFHFQRGFAFRSRDVTTDGDQFLFCLLVLGSPWLLFYFQAALHFYLAFQALFRTFSPMYFYLYFLMVFAWILRWVLLWYIFDTFWVNVHQRRPQMLIFCGLLFSFDDILRWSRQVLRQPAIPNLKRFRRWMMELWLTLYIVNLCFLENWLSFFYIWLCFAAKSVVRLFWHLAGDLILISRKPPILYFHTL